MYVLTYCQPDGKTPARHEFTIHEAAEAVMAFYQARDAGMVNLFLGRMEYGISVPIMMHPGVRE